MAEKPRVKAPKQRQSSSADASSRRRTWTIAAAVGGVALGFVVVAVLLGLVGGGDGPDEAALRAELEAAGCTLRVAPTRGYPERSHAVTDPNGTSPDWTTDPPTSGPHYGIAAIFGIFEEELQLARVVHNLEHGGVYIFYGDEVPDETVEQLRSFYDDHQAGTIMAPLDRLGDDFVLGAWVFDGDTNEGFLARCTEFDEGAVESFFSALQFRGPERFDPADLQPGH